MVGLTKDASCLIHNVRACGETLGFRTIIMNMLNK